MKDKHSQARSTYKKNEKPVDDKKEQNTGKNNKKYGQKGKDDFSKPNNQNNKNSNRDMTKNKNRFTKNTSDKEVNVLDIVNESETEIIDEAAGNE